MSVYACVATRVDVKKQLICQKPKQNKTSKSNPNKKKRKSNATDSRHSSTNKTKQHNRRTQDTDPDVPVRGLHARDGRKDRLYLQDGGCEDVTGDPLGCELIPADLDRQKLHAIASWGTSVRGAHAELPEQKELVERETLSLSLYLSLSRSLARCENRKS